ncbi:hypothetical protein EP837_03182 [Sphingobium sp. EP60837]|nr:hypothetical protein EP837_03182 [Sphingobium sp. EP60837]
MTAPQSVSSRNRSAVNRNLLSFAGRPVVAGGPSSATAPPSFSQAPTALSSRRSRAKESAQNVRSRAAPRASVCRSTLACKSRCRSDEDDDDELGETDMSLSSPNGSTSLSQSRHVWKNSAGIGQYTIGPFGGLMDSSAQCAGNMSVRWAGAVYGRAARRLARPRFRSRNMIGSPYRGASILRALQEAAHGSE